MDALHLRPLTLALRGIGFAFVCTLMACTDDGLGELQPRTLAGTEGRTRYLVTFEKSGPDLGPYRAIPKDNAAELLLYVENKRTETALGQAQLDAALSVVGGKVVERWWMSNQATIEVAATGLATLRAIEGVKSVDPDQPLQ